MSEREREPIDVVLDAFFSSLSLVRSRLFRTSVLLHTIFRIIPGFTSGEEWS